MTLPCTRSSWGPTCCRPVSRIAPTPQPCNAVFRASGNTAAAPDPRQPHPQRVARLPPGRRGPIPPRHWGAPAGAPAGGTFAKEWCPSRRWTPRPARPSASWAPPVPPGPGRPRTTCSGLGTLKGRETPAR
ncbi:unnamed protein product [Eretmochelys imbricata]